MCCSNMGDSSSMTLSTSQSSFRRNLVLADSSLCQMTADLLTEWLWATLLGGYKKKCARSDYIKEGLKHLCDPQVYRKLNRDTTQTTKQDIFKLLVNIESWKLMPWLMSQFCRPPSIHRTSQLYYFLKKIHKSLMRIRLMVSSVNSITENISKFVDHWLQPIVKELPSYIKDTNSFATLITQTVVPRNCRLVSIDVSSLYTNIPVSKQH